jgi:uncharacterized linocin/CFP29 family protein
MHSDLVELGWTEESWNRLLEAVSEEAQRARVAAQMLPLVGPEERTTLAVPEFAISSGPAPADAAHPAAQRLTVDSNPTLYLTTIAVNVFLRSHEAADPQLTAALGMFRRAANYIARIEDALVFNGRSAHAAPELGLAGIPPVFTVSGEGAARGLVKPLELDRRDSAPERQRVLLRLQARGAALQGDDVITAIIGAIGQLDARGQQGPYACALSTDLFARVCTPNPNLVLPRDRILPFLQGPLLRASTLQEGQGVVVALSGSPVELVVGSDIGIRYLQATLEPRYAFRISERVALRIREENAIAILA